MYGPPVAHPAQPPVSEGQGPHIPHCRLPRVPGEAKVKLRSGGAEGHTSVVTGRRELGVQGGELLLRKLERGIQGQGQEKARSQRAGGD